MLSSVLGCCPYRLSRESDSGGPPDPDVLAQFRYAPGLPPARDPRQVHVPLPQAGDRPMAEVWRSRRSVEPGRADGCAYAHDGEVLFGHVHVPEPEMADLARATADTYARIDALVRRLGYPHWLRTWNFLAHINHGDGDAERYRQFSLGRHQALARRHGFETRLPAATCIGTRDAGMTVCLLAAREPGAQVENPRQVSAFRYPPVHGPKSPSFSRACLKHWQDVSHLFVSGTASVVGHESAHRGDLLAQLDETHRNFEALLAHAQGAAGEPFHPAALKAYVRAGEDAPAVLARMRRLFGADTPLLCLVGDICRRDLLVEIEGLYTAPQRRASLAVA